MATGSDQQFLQLADACMQAVQARLDGFDPDELEADFANGVVRITFADGRTCILNRQAAAHQIWLAEGAEAWHFTHSPETGTWIDTKGRGELRSILGAIIGRRIGRRVDI